MVKLEQEQGGLPEFGTVLAQPRLRRGGPGDRPARVRVEDPDALDDAVRDALAHPGPVLLDVLTNPDEISVPGKVKLDQAWGFAIAKIRETRAQRGRLGLILV